MLYNGCRSGEIFSIDVRQRSRKGQNWKAIRLFHDSAVTSIRLLEAEHYLMAADMAGKVWVWRTVFCSFRCLSQSQGWVPVLWGLVWNWVVVPYESSSRSTYQPSSTLCFVNISSFKQLLQHVDKTVGPENSKVCEAVQRSSQ